MAERKNDKEHLVLESALREITDFIGYVDIPTKMLYIIRHRDEPCSEEKPMEFDYEYGIEKLIRVNIVDEDKSVCRKMFALSNIIDTVDRYGVFTGTFRIKMEDEKIRYKRLSMHYLDSDKNSLVAIQDDFTEIAKVDHQTQENIRGALLHAEANSQAKTKFLFSMSHEIRTPLNAIVVLSQLGRDRAKDVDYLNYCFEKIDESSKMVLNMIESVLDIVHVENNDMALDEKVVRFRPFIDKVVQKAKSDAHAKKIKLEVDVDDQIASGFKFDAAKLDKVISNLLSNSVKFSQRFGKITLEVKLISDDVDTQSLEFSVADTGMGISDEFKQRVFDPFEQEHTVGAAGYGGAGLGLTICKNIIKRMGGTIEFDSLKGKGSIFRVNLDLPVAMVTPDDEAEISEDIFAGRRVLLADDNTINLEIERQILLDRGMIVDVAENGQEALSQYMSNEPGTYDLILMDVRMPYMDGLIATKKIRESGKSDCKTIPILALTANAFAEDVAKSFECGMNAHITKPIEVDELFRIMHRAIQGELEQ